MSSATDKARFHLEQTVPELREWQRRELFSVSEIRAIAKRRSEFEHAINSRGSRPAEFVRYIEYERNLDTLVRKRTKRKHLSPKSKSSKHSKHHNIAQRRIFGIFDRATYKQPGNLELWIQYIEYCQHQNSHVKLSKILTEALRLHPTKPLLWIYAARYSFEVQGDMAGARSAMQRGIRFCKSSKELYLEFARVEMAYLAKVAGRRKILGLDREVKTVEEEEDGESGDAIEGDNTIRLPTITAGESEDMILNGDDHRQKTKGRQDEAMVNIYSTPAMTGAIPRAIFDAALKQFPGDDELGERFFALFAEFQSVPSAKETLQHCVDSLSSLYPSSACTHSCICRLPLLGIHHTDTAFPAAIREFLKQLKRSSAQVSDKLTLLSKIQGSMKPTLDADDLEPELKQVLDSVLQIHSNGAAKPGD